MRFVFVRHGKCLGNELNLTYSHTDYSLSEKGIEELKQLKEEYDYPETDVYVSSDLKRAIETFYILYPDKKLEGTYELLREHDWGSLEGKKSSDDWKELNNWTRGIRNGSEESYQDFEKRVINITKELYHSFKGRSITVVAHCGIIRVLYIYLNHLESKDYINIDIKNGHAYIFDIDYKKDELFLLSYKSLDGDTVFHKDCYSF